MTPLRFLDKTDRARVRELAERVSDHDGVEALSEATMIKVASGEPGDYELLVEREDPADDTSAVVGIAHVDHPEGAPGVEIAVDPKARRRGIGSGLARAVLGAHPTARFWAHGFLPAARATAKTLDLEVVRELWKMHRPGGTDGPTDPSDVPVPDGYAWRTFQEGDAEAWVAANASAFASHPEQGRVGLDELRARMDEPWFDADGFFLLHPKSTPEQVAAFHWTKIPADGDPGEIYVLGVHPDHQGNGLGRTATALGLAYLAGKGVPGVDLYVEGDNEAAIAIYEAAGFSRSALDVQLASASESVPSDGPATDDNAVGDSEQQPAASAHTVSSLAQGEATGTVTSSVTPRRSPDSRFTPLPQTETRSPDFPTDRFLDRELSWLAFNERVMQMAEDEYVPLLERVNFVSIFASNLDEFFMVRVAGLKRRIATGLAVRSASGLEPRELLERIHTVSAELQKRHATLMQRDILPALNAEGITLNHWDTLSTAEQRNLSDWFDETVFPVLTPLAVDPAHPFPYISGLSLNLAVVLINRETRNEHFARLKIPSLLPRLVELGPVGDEDYRARFIPIEDIIAANLGRLFPGMEVHEHFTFRITRNEDLEVEEDDAENLLAALEKELTRRRFGPAVRLEVEAETSEHVMALLTREMNITAKEVRHLPAPLDLRGLSAIADLERSDLKYPAFVPRTNADLARVESSKAANIFSAIGARDVLVQHPYDSFSTSVQAFVEQAAADPNVLAIRQTLYRTSGDSPIIDALIDAADSGKQVLAVVEIKARFDEQNNIEWARKLEHVGVHVVYGVVGLKTHCKLSQVIRRERGGLVRYCHIGTGNYHPKTARIYEDYGLFTRDEVVAEDVTKLFNQLSGWAPATEYERLLVAPRTVRSGLLTCVEEQIERAKAGKEAYVAIKVNSIVDEAIIDTLYRASQAGVKVDVLVRGICSLRPGVPGMSENIEVRSVIGRFLEHSRVFLFGPAGERVAFIGSADMMHRNLDRRVEALVRLGDPRHIAQVYDLLELGMSEETASYHLGGDGRWTRHYHGADGTPLTDMQAELIARHAARRKKSRSR